MCQRIAELFGLPIDGAHFQEALTHPSYANERGSKQHNQRLEFLGDAVLGLCVSQLLFERFPDSDEGVLTRLRSRLVSTDALAEWAREHEVAEALLLGRGAEASKLRESDNVLADLVEALIAATFLDVGLEQARCVCRQLVTSRLQVLEADRASLDPKTELQQRVQALGCAAPTYEVLEAGGPAHDRWFRVRARFGDVCGAEGKGRSKRLAERQAAQRTLDSDVWTGIADDAVAGASRDD